MRKVFTRPSSGLIVGLIALFVALGGTSYAAITSLPTNSVGTPQLKNGAVTAAKINASARVSPVVYAHIYADGKIDVARSKGITQSMVYHRSTSAYCFSGLPFTPKGGSATIDYGQTGNGVQEAAQLQITSGTAGDCNAGEHVEVATDNVSGSFAAQAFYLVLYG